MSRETGNSGRKCGGQEVRNYNTLRGKTRTTDLRVLLGGLIEWTRRDELEDMGASLALPKCECGQVIPVKRR